jgi:hypothetical protein
LSGHVASLSHKLPLLPVLVVVMAVAKIQISYFLNMSGMFVTKKSTLTSLSPQSTTTALPAIELSPSSLHNDTAIKVSDSNENILNPLLSLLSVTKYDKDDDN